MTSPPRCYIHYTHGNTNSHLFLQVSQNHESCERHLVGALSSDCPSKWPWDADPGYLNDVDKKQHCRLWLTTERRNTHTIPHPKG